MSELNALTFLFSPFLSSLLKFAIDMCNSVTFQVRERIQDILNILLFLNLLVDILRNEIL